MAPLPGDPDREKQPPKNKVAEPVLYCVFWFTTNAAKALSCQYRVPLWEYASRRRIKMTSGTGGPILLIGALGRHAVVSHCGMIVW